MILEFNLQQKQKGQPNSQKKHHFPVQLTITVDDFILKDEHKVADSVRDDLVTKNQKIHQLNLAFVVRKATNHHI